MGPPRFKSLRDFIHVRNWFQRTASMPSYLISAERDDIEQRLRQHYKDWYGYCPPDHLLLKSVAEVEKQQNDKPYFSRVRFKPT